MAAHEISSKPSVVALDCFRGLAALAMIFNHAGFSLLNSHDAVHGLPGTFVFLGSFAPVLFFFATGFSIGLPQQFSKGVTSDTLWKAAFLLLADQCLFWSRGDPYGLDFFGFIALSMLCIHAIGPIRRSTAVAAALLALVVVVRFVVGPLTKGIAENSLVLRFVTGALGQDHVSYPLGPWFAYPLAGFVCARIAFGRGVPAFVAWVADRRCDLVLLLGALFCAAVAAMMYWRGLSFHRWSSMAAGFFVLSAAVLAVAGVVSRWIARVGQPLSRWLSIRGVAAFAVVPLHYATIRVLVESGLAPVSAGTYFAMSCVLCIFIFWASRGFAKLAASATSGSGIPMYMIGGLVAAAGAVSVMSATAVPGIAFAAAIAGQLLAALGLARRAQPAGGDALRRVTSR